MRILLVLFLVGCGEQDITPSSRARIAGQSPERLEVEAFQEWIVDKAEDNEVRQEIINDMLGMAYEIVDRFPRDNPNSTQSGMIRCIKDDDGNVNKIVMEMQFFELDQQDKHVNLMYVTGVCLRTVELRLTGGLLLNPNLDDLLANRQYLDTIADRYDENNYAIESTYFDKLNDNYIGGE